MGGRNINLSSKEVHDKILQMKALKSFNGIVGSWQGQSWIWLSGSSWPVLGINICFVFTGNNVHYVPFLMADTGCPFAATWHNEFYALARLWSALLFDSYIFATIVFSKLKLRYDNIILVKMPIFF